MITHIRRHKSGEITVVESTPLPSKRRGGRSRTRRNPTRYKDWSEVPDGAELRTYVTCDCCGAIEMGCGTPITDRKLSEYSKKLGGHLWCRECQSEHRPTKLPLPLSSRQPNRKYAKGVRVFASFEDSPAAQEVKKKLVEMVEQLWLPTVWIK